MPTPITITLMLNSLTLTLTVGFLLLILWHDPRRLTNLYFAWFLLMFAVWSAGSLLGRGAALAGAEPIFVQSGLRLLEIGFTGAALALYLYVIILVGNRSKQFQAVGVVTILLLLAYHMLLLVLNATPHYEIAPSGLLRYRFTPTSTFVFALIDLATLGLVWQSFRKMQRPALAFGVMLFGMGQLTALFSPRLQALAIAEDAGAIATMVMVFALVQTQIIQPLAGQTRQIEVVRDVGLAITSRLRLQSVLQTIAAQAAALLGADASIIFLRREGEDELLLAAQYNIHKNLLGHRLGLNAGLAGKVATERRPVLLVDYRREWKGIPDTPFAEQGFGSVIAVPLIFAGDVVGVLLVINGHESRLFDQEEVRLLELLAPQAAVSITNSRLFEQERALSDELEVAKTRLEAFLLSTDNPVIALNKNLQVIFANKAAAELVANDAPDLRQQSLLDLVPRTYLPPFPRQLVRDLKKHKSHVYELKIEEKTYLCHLARISQPERGWVAVLNDVSTLKELERLQRQMVELTTHQLKNPLQAAMLHLDELEDLGEEVLTDEMRYDIQIIWQQLERMSRLIRGILNLERIQSRSSTPQEQVDFAQVTRSVIHSLQELAETSSIQLDLTLSEPLPLVIGDPEELTEAVSNLVDNAIKYTPPNGAVQVEVCAEMGDILLKVRDTGIGIPREAQSRIFDRFYRVEQPGTEQIGGTGMGLSLVKAIVESHKGRIWLESAPYQGTTFYVSLPGLR